MVVYFVLVENGKIVRISDGLVRLLGVSKSELLGREASVLRGLLGAEQSGSIYFLGSGQEGAILEVERVELGSPESYVLLLFDPLLGVGAQVFEYAPEPILILFDGRVVYENRSSISLFGHLRGEGLDALFGDDCRLLDSQTSVEMGFRLKLKRKGLEGMPLSVLCHSVSREVRILYLRKQQRVEPDAEEKKDIIASLFEETREAVYVARGDGSFLHVNQAFLELFGTTMEEVKKANIKEGYFDEAEMERLRHILRRSDSVKDLEVRLRKRSGEPFQAAITVTVRRTPYGKVAFYEGIIRDITQRKRMEESLLQMAYYDALTGLPNRRLAMDRLNMGIASAKRNGRRLAVMLMDLDGFKLINDRFGHAMGDKLLREVGKRLKASLRQQDTVARIGGDEFLLFVLDVRERRDAEVAARKVLRAFDEPFIVEGIDMRITPSIGIALFPDDGGDPEMLVANADVAMYFVKEKGKNGYVFFSSLFDSREEPC